MRSSAAPAIAGDAVSVVVIGTSLAPGSDRVVEAGAAFARAVGGTALLVHVQSPRTGAAGVEENERRLRSQAERLGPRTATNWELLTAHEPWRVLLAATPARDGVLVVGAHDSDGVLGIRLGGSTALLLRRSHCALLVIRGLGPFPILPSPAGHPSRPGPAAKNPRGSLLTDLPAELVVEHLPERRGLLGPWRRWRLLQRVLRLSSSVLLLPDGARPVFAADELASTA